MRSSRYHRPPRLSFHQSKTKRASSLVSGIWCGVFSFRQARALFEYPSLQSGGVSCVAMAPRRVRPRGAVSDFAEVVSKVAGDYVKDRRLCFSLALGATSLALFTAHQTSRPDIKEQFRAASAERAERRAASRARATGKRSKPAGDDVSRDATASCASSAAVSADGTSPMAVAVAEQRRKGEPRRRGAAVDAVFVKRLAFILRIVVPSITSKEAMLLAIQSTMLVTRSFISLRIARKGGDGLRAVMERSWKKFFFVLGDFFVSGVSASVVNSALKYLTNSITVSFRERLTERVHREYLRDGAFYRAAVLRVGNLDNADQRIADDLHQFCHTASDLFARTFKPLLDVVLSTARMAENMGYGGLAVLYGYFVLSGALIKTLSPPFSEYIARTQKLEGDFRRAHSRLIQHAEEVAFLDGSAREKEMRTGSEGCFPSSPLDIALFCPPKAPSRVRLPWRDLGIVEQEATWARGQALALLTLCVCVPSAGTSCCPAGASAPLRVLRLLAEGLLADDVAALQALRAAAGAVDPRAWAHLVVVLTNSVTSARTAPGPAAARRAS